MVKATVAGLIVKEDNGVCEKILLTKRAIAPFCDCWSLPGGHIEDGEKAIDAVIREIREETGLNFDAEFFSYNDEIFENYGFNAVVLVFIGGATGNITVQEEELSECKWFTIAEALKLDLAFNHKDIILSYALKNQYCSEHESTGIIEEFKALRQEVNTIFYTRIWGVATYLIIVAGTLASMDRNSCCIGFVLIIYTAIPFILYTAARERSRLRIASYMREVLEKQHPGLKWETYLEKWRWIFFNKNNWKGIISILGHVLSLSGIHLMIPLFAFAGLLFSQNPDGTPMCQGINLYKYLGVLGILLCLLSVIHFVRIYPKAESYRAKAKLFLLGLRYGLRCPKNGHEKVIR